MTAGFQQHPRLRRSGLAFAVMFLGALIWVVALVGAPYLVAHQGQGRLGHAIAALVYRTGGLLCHQRPARSFSVGAVPLPVCARCTGLYLSAPLGIAGAWAAWRRRSRHRGRVEGSGWRTTLAVTAVPTILTLVLEWSHTAVVPNAARSLAAWPIGIAVAWMVAGTLADLAESRRGPKRAAGGVSERSSRLDNGVNCKDA